MRAAFIAKHPSPNAILAAERRRRDRQEGPRDLAPVRQFRSLETAMRHGQRRAA